MSWTRKRAAFIATLTNIEESTTSTLKYRMGVISDSHVSYTNGESHLTSALQTLYDKKAEFIVSCGDPTVNGTDNEWSTYLNIIDSSPYGRDQIYECIGNHEFRSDGEDASFTKFRINANNGRLADGSGIPYFSVSINGDLFIFLMIEHSTPNSADCFSTEQLDWLESELDTHYGKDYNIFILEHSLFYGWGSGDAISNGSATYPRALSLSYSGHVRLKSILEVHPNVIMLHGHTHIRLEDITSGLIVYAEPENGGCHQLHVPSITAGKTLSSSGEPSVDWSMPPECWICDVYSDKLVFTGIRADTGIEIPNMVYTIAK